MVENLKVYFGATVVAMSEKNEAFGISGSSSPSGRNVNSMGLVRSGDTETEVSVSIKARGIRTKAASKDEDYVLGEQDIVFKPGISNIPLSNFLAILPDNIEEETERIILYIDTVNGGRSEIGSPSEMEVLVVDESQIPKQTTASNV
jgi:hypothetical protein